MRAPRLDLNDSLVVWLDAQSFAPDAGLPSEREIVELLGLSRFQVRQSLALLERQGRIVGTREGWRMARARDESLEQKIVVLAAESPAPMPGAATAPNQTARVWLGMSEAASRHGLRLVTILSGDLGPGFLRRLVRQRPAGLVCLQDVVRNGQALAVAQAAWSAEVPCVAMGDWVRPEELDRWPADLVLTDHAGGCHALVHWLHAHGARRPWLLGWRTDPPAPPSRWWRSRRAGFAAACTELGLPVPAPCDPLCNPTFSYDADGLAEQARIIAGYLLEPLRNGMDAILMLNDGPAQMVGAALRLLGRQPNRDILIAGFDNTHTFYPEAFRLLCGCGPLITYDKDEPAVGNRLIDLLAQRLARRLPPEPQRVTVAGRLVEST